MHLFPISFFWIEHTHLSPISTDHHCLMDFFRRILPFEIFWKINGINLSFFMVIAKAFSMDYFVDIDSMYLI